MSNLRRMLGRPFQSKKAPIPALMTGFAVKAADA
jgi:hypothetical protein